VYGDRIDNIRFLILLEYKISTKWIFRRKYRVSNSSSYCTGRRATEIEKWRRRYFYLVWASFMWLSLKVLWKH